MHTLPFMVPLLFVPTFTILRDRIIASVSETGNSAIIEPDVARKTYIALGRILAEWDARNGTNVVPICELCAHRPVFRKELHD